MCGKIGSPKKSKTPYGKMALRLKELEQELEQLKHLFGQLRPEFKEYVLKELQNLLELQDKADAYRRTK